MGWYDIANALKRKDKKALREMLAGEVDPGRALELALREMGFGPVLASTIPGSLGLYHVWHWCVDCGCAFAHSQASCDEHRDHTIVTVPVYQSKLDVTPQGAHLVEAAHATY